MTTLPNCGVFDEAFGRPVVRVVEHVERLGRNWNFVLPDRGKIALERNVGLLQARSVEVLRAAVPKREGRRSRRRRRC